MKTKTYKPTLKHARKIAELTQNENGEWAVKDASTGERIAAFDFMSATLAADWCDMEGIQVVTITACDGTEIK